MLKKYRLSHEKNPMIYPRLSQLSRQVLARSRLFLYLFHTEHRLQFLFPPCVTSLACINHVLPGGHDATPTHACRGKEKDLQIFAPADRRFTRDFKRCGLARGSAISTAIVPSRSEKIPRGHIPHDQTSKMSLIFARSSTLTAPDVRNNESH